MAAAGCPDDAGPCGLAHGPVVLTWADGAALLAVLVWGASFPILKWVMTVVPPLPAMLLRSVLSSAVLVGVLAARGRWRWPRRAEAGQLLGVGLVGYALNQILYSYGLHLTTASHSGLIFTLTPLFVYGMSHLLGHLRIGRLDLAGLALGLVGGVLILGAPAPVAAGAGGPTLLGDLLTVGAAITWGIWIILAAPVLNRHGTLLGTTWITMTGTLGLLPVTLPAVATHAWGQVTGPAWGGLVFTGTVAGALGSVLWYAAVRHLGPARSVVYANLESFFAVVAAWAMLGERIAASALAGGVLVAAGVLMTRRPRRGG